MLWIWSGKVISFKKKKRKIWFFKVGFTGCYNSYGKTKFWLAPHCHAPNPIFEFVTMTGMLISSLNLILTRTNLTLSKTFTKAFLFLFILVSLLKWYNFPLDFQSIYIVPQRITQSIDYSNSKFYIIHLLIL